MIFWARLIIFDRYGGIMFDGTATAPPNEFLTGDESAITWDGYLSGKKLSSGVYTYLIEYKSCSDSKNCTDLKDSALSLLTSQSNSVGCSDVTLIW